MVNITPLTKAVFWDGSYFYQAPSETTFLKITKVRRLPVVATVIFHFLSDHGIYWNQ